MYPTKLITLLTMAHNPGYTATFVTGFHHRPGLSVCMTSRSPVQGWQPHCRQASCANQSNSGKTQVHKLYWNFLYAAVAMSSINGLNNRPDRPANNEEHMQEHHSMLACNNATNLLCTKELSLPTLPLLLNPTRFNATPEHIAPSCIYPRSRKRQQPVV